MNAGVRAAESEPVLGFSTMLFAIVILVQDGALNPTGAPAIAILLWKFES
jgi:hypothetical protein